VSETRLAMARFTDGRGNKARVEMDMLLVPYELYEPAWEIINSTGKVDVADNNRNFHQGRYKLLAWNELTSPTNWFALDSSLMKMCLWWIDRVPFETYDKFDGDTQTLTFGAYMRYGFGASEWRWVFGHQVAS